jgi:putative flippase GtrA
MCRSLLTGGVATLVDLLVLGVAVGSFGVDPRIANIPALLAGAVVQFAGNRHFAFRAADGPLGKQALLFALTEVVALTLNALGFELVARAVALDASGALLGRVVVSFFVFMLWSHPVWTRVFSSEPLAPSSAAGYARSLRGGVLGEDA